MINIVYEDRDILALDKPAGIVIHPDKHHKVRTLIQEVIEKYPEIKNVGENKERPGVVHRLDKDTSGIILIAKNQEAFLYLKNIFQERKIEKKYIVLVVGRLKEKEGVIDLPIARAKKDPTKRVAVGKTRGQEREAKTEYKVLEYLTDGEQQYSLCEARPLTGRTHQIRTHFAAMGYPVVCDRLYAGKKYICLNSLKRHFLHAKSLEFISPSGARLLLEAALAEDLQKVLDKLHKTE